MESQEIIEEASSYGLTPKMVKQLTDAIEAQDHYNLAFYVTSLHDAEVADYLSVATHEHRLKLLDFIADDLHATVLLNIDTHVLPEIIEHIGFEKAAKLIIELEIDDAVYVLERLNNNFKEHIFSLLPESKIYPIKELLSYPENSAGRIMNPRIVKAMEYWTIEQTLNFLRHNRSIPENYFQIFILNLQHVPIGFVNLSKILAQPLDTVIGDIIERELMVVNANTSQNEVSFIFKQYAVNALPVVNRQGRLVGVIDVNDAIEVVAEEAEEDYLKLAGVANSDIHLSFFQNSLKRLPWLAVNLIGSLLTSHLISYFGTEIEKMVILASIMPIVASIGGNAGTQTLTVIIRALATKNLIESNSWRIITKEVSTSLCNAAIISSIGGTLIYFLTHNYLLSIVFSLAIIFNFIMAGLMGSLIPVIMNKMKIDPAISSSIFLTAITDIAGFCSFLVLARILLIG